jgi:precorrin-2 dehydrogenase/sirohydrochlorin ferrochelatase
MTMLPVTLNLSLLRVALIGTGGGIFRRLKKLDAADAKHVTVFDADASEALKQQAGERLIMRLPQDAELARFHLVLVVDIADDIAFAIADKARASGALVNVEDRKDYCDFYYSAVVRRGDLVIGINTGGQCPTLTVRIREILEKVFPPIWAERLKELGMLRQKWRKEEQLSMKETMARTDTLLEKKGWMGDELCPRNKQP